jgi:hypothetical protein
MPKKTRYLPIALALCAFASLAAAQSDAFKENLFDPGKLKPIDSLLKVKVGQPAPDFDLPSVAHGRVTLGGYRGQKNVVLSFVPAAWTPVCSDQWPGYNIAKPLFDDNDTILLGISVDNLPTLHAWTGQMGELWFENCGFRSYRISGPMGRRP